jgi:uncharacterized protein DUF6481
MSFMNGNSFADRQAAAAKARKEMAEKFLANSKYDPADPAVVEREARRKEILEARKVRDAERAKRKAEQAARQEQLRLEALAREAELQRQREEAERLEYEKKLERDARYAARKERKKKRKSAAERYG